MMKSAMTLGTVLCMSLLAWGCSTYSGSELSAQGGFGNLKFHLETGDDDVTGFCFEVRELSGTLVEERCVDLSPMDFPPRLMSEAGPNHSFSDAYFVLEPGTYLVKATPMAGEVPSSECSPSEEQTVDVSPSRTTEVFLISQCETVDNGGLDIVALINHEPVITDLVFDPSKFVDVCERLTVTVTAVDQDGDPLTYSWTLISGPSDCGFEPYRNTLNFKACRAADYEVEVSACDPFGLCATLQFPIHVVVGP